MNIPILCLTNEKIAESFAQRLTEKDLPVRIATKDAEAGKIFVVESEMRNEAGILNEARDEAVDEAVLHCPSCHSPRIDFPALPDKSPTMRFLATITAEKEGSSVAAFSCRECHLEWIGAAPESVPAP